MKTYRTLAMQRTEAERQRRHIHGDRGSKFSAAKILVPRKDELAKAAIKREPSSSLEWPSVSRLNEVNTLTSALKDNLIIEISNGI